jgi:trk system potassium uptake protein TrkH
MRLTDPRISALQFAVRPRLIAHYLGQMLLAAAVIVCVPAAVSIHAGDATVAARYAVVIMGFALFGALGARLPVLEDLQRNEALVIAGLTFVLPPLALAWPIAGYGMAWEDALFEAISGITTTGLTMLDGLETRPDGLLFARAWLQWAGGLSIVVLVLALLANPGMATRNLGFNRFETGDIAASTHAHARRVLAIYVALTSIGFISLWLLGGNAFTALLHTLAAVSTGGFSSSDDSLAALQAPSRFVVMALCFAGALPFYSYYRPAASTWRAMLADAQLRAFVSACLLTSALLYVLIPDGGGPLAVHAGQALLLGTSAQTTAGFTSIDIGALNPAAHLVLILSMLTGGSMGSTAGGIKVFRMLILLRLIRLLFARLMMPSSARIGMQIGNSGLERNEIETMLAVIGCYGIVLILSWLVFLAYGQAPLPALFEISSALATCGLSAGVTLPALAPALKAVLCFDMLFGRVEAVALVILVLPGTWIGRRRRSI